MSSTQMSPLVKRVAEPAAARVDLTAYLPRKPLEEFLKHEIIYSPQQPRDNLYLVVTGRVKVGHAVSSGETVCTIVHKGSLFGEPALVNAEQRSDSAVALGPVTLMGWNRSEIEEQVERDPRLGLALSRHLARNCMELAERMKARVVHKTPERVMLAMVQFAHQAGVRTADGSTRVESLTHQTLAEYVGTSREVVTFQLNRLRRLGLVHYNRKHIDVAVDRLEEVLGRTSSSRLPEKNSRAAS